MLSLIQQNSRSLQARNNNLMLKCLKISNELGVQEELRIRLQQSLNDPVDLNQAAWGTEEPDQLINTLFAAEKLKTTRA